MKKKAIIPLILVLILVTALTACQEEGDTETEPAGTEVMIYYCNADDTGLLSAACSLPEETEEEGIMEIFSVMQSGQFTDGHAAVPGTLTLDHVAWQENSAVLYLEGSYPAAGTVEELLCRSALVYTLVQFEDIEGVVVNVNGEPLTDGNGTEFGVLQTDSILLDVSGAVGEQEEITLTLYFANETGDGLARETVETVRGSDETPESLVMKQLAAGPAQAGHQAVLPAGTGVASVQVKDGICYVNLDSGFVDGELNLDAALTVYAIVDSLTELDGIEQVQLTVNGSSDVMFRDEISLAAPFDRNTALIGGQE